jgi:rod shape determining protein RodA
MKIKRRIPIDWILLGLTLLICAAGLVVIYSAGFDAETGRSRSFEKQLFSMVLGFGAIILCAFISPHTWRRYAWVIYGISILLLAYVLVGGVVAGGARRWIGLGFFRFQPAEYSKIGLILVYAWIFSRRPIKPTGLELTDLFLPLFVLAVPVALIFREPDLGTALCHVLIAGTMLLLIGIRRRVLISLVLIGAIAAVPAFGMLKEYQRQRLFNFMSPERDPLGTGYHALQSKIAVGSGGVFGKGFMNGSQTQLRFLPEQTTDFLYSVLAEEWGFAGSVLVVLLYIALIMRIITAAGRSGDSFSTYVVIGVGAMIFWHAVINIGMVIGLVPVVGVTLKLLSYGGSSVLAALLAIGIVNGLGSRRIGY